MEVKEAVPRGDSMHGVGELSPAATRSFLYGVFAESFVYPQAELVASIQSGTLADRLNQLLRRLDQSNSLQVDQQALQDAGDQQDDLEVEYSRLFDVGASGPLCALEGGVHCGPRMQNMEETLRFYSYFGLTLPEKMQELPDHLTVQLEFLHFLTYCEDLASESGADPVAYQRAQRDFIARHPGRWIPRMQVKLHQARPLPFYRELVQLLEAFLQFELLRLQELHGRASIKPPGIIQTVDI